jgi:4-hydroxy-tetrahydrodipicolinate reductase
MAQIKVLVHGALGRMGQEVLKAVSLDPGLHAVAGVDIKGEAGEVTVAGGSGAVPLSINLEPAIVRHAPDVMVDFSTAGATMPAVRSAVKHGVGLVIGTTGLSSADLSEIESLCRQHRVGAVVAANFSLAAALMVHAAKAAARFFDYAEIIEMHHEQKADAPSGTALATAQRMFEARGKPFVHGLAAPGNAPSRGSDYQGISLHSVRMPGLLAHQQVIFGAAGQTLTIRLDQISREAFMPSVLLAIRKAKDLKEAVFGLESILGL